MEKLAAGLAKLDEHYRAVLVLRYYEDLPPREIAKRLSIPVETVRTRHRRALVRLREDLDRGGRDWRRALLFLFPKTRRTGAVAGVALLVVVVALFAVTIAQTGSGHTTVTSQEGVPRATVAVRSGERVDPISEANTKERTVVASPSSSPGPASLQVHAERVGGEAAAFLPVLLEHWTADGRGNVQQVVTAEDGSFRMNDPLPGIWRVSPLVGRAKWVRVADEATSTCLLEIPSGRQVSGTTLRRNSVAMKGARILVSWPGRDDQWVERAVSNDEGRYVLDHVDPTSWIGASRTGRASESWSVRSHGATQLELDLPTRKNATLHRGRVTDSSGAGIPFARVWLVSGDEPVRLENGFLRSPRSPGTVVSDENGDFEIHLTGNRLFADADGFAPGVIDFSGSRWKKRERLEITLTRGAEVAGTVSDASGDSVAGVIVHLLNERGLLLQETRSTEGGTYLFRGAPIGQLELKAWTDSLSGGVGSFSTQLNTRLGERSEVSASLDHVASIQGRAVDASGKPLTGWIVRLGKTEDNSLLETKYVKGSPERVLRTKQDGSFRADGLDDESYDVWLFAPGHAETAPRAWRRQVAPPTSSLELVLPAQPPTSSLSGRVSSRESLSVSLWSPDSGWSGSVAAHPSDRSFSFGELPEGSYRVGVLTPLMGIVELCAVQLERGASLDIGELPLPQGLSLSVEVESSSGLPLDAVQLVLTRAGKRIEQIAPSADSDFLFSGLSPGRYGLLVWSRDHKRSRQRLQVEASATLKVTLDPLAR